MRAIDQAKRAHPDGFSLVRTEPDSDAVSYWRGIPFGHRLSRGEEIVAYYRLVGAIWIVDAPSPIVSTPETRRLAATLAKREMGVTA